MTVLRSMLFVPGDSEKKMAKGGSIGADALILDLEDSVAASRRPLAREMVHDYLKNAGRAGGELWVRINPLDTADALRDVAAVASARPDGIALPKCNGPEDVVQLSHYLDALEIEHGIPQGIIAICAIATETAVAPFSLGQIRHAAIDPASFRLLAAKGVHAPVAAYSEVCPSFIRVNTPGVTTADLSRLTYRHRRRPLFPWER